MGQRAVGLYSDPWCGVEQNSAAARRGPAAMYRYAVWFKANPRSEAYMRVLFDERYPGGQFVNAGSDGAWRRSAGQAGTVVLLYPDATGLGLRWLEREAQRARAEGAELRVLNGRRRDFRLDAATLSALRLRRLLERSMLLEVLAIAAFAVLTPLLLAKDWLSGRR